MCREFVCLAVFVGVVVLVRGHGRMMNPVQRSSMWREGYHTPVNYDDDGLDCGGFSTQWDENGGKCGECGDAYNLPRPRPNEAGGEYGNGIIVKTYQQAQVVNVTIELTTNHMGWFEFRVCVNNNPQQYVNQSCLDENLLELADGSGTRWHLPNHQEEGAGVFIISVRLPVGLTCSQCVIQWWWKTANSWGTCPGGFGAMGCGEQETFVNCADIAVE